MKAKLLVVGGDVKAAEINLKLPTVVGRGRHANLTVPHPLVSRKHCELFERDGILMVRDLGSLNGTYVGSDRVTEAAIPPGELLTIGAVNFRAVYCEPEVDDTRPPDATGNEESTVRKADERGKSAARADTADVPRPKPQAGIKAGYSVERDTEWQVGNISEGKKPDDSEDLSSLLNDTR